MIHFLEQIKKKEKKEEEASSLRLILLLRLTRNQATSITCVYDIMYAFSSADRLLFVINTIKEEIVNRVQDNSNNNGTSMAEKLDKLIEETLGKKFSQIRLFWNSNSLLKVL